MEEQADLTPGVCDTQASAPTSACTAFSDKSFSYDWGPWHRVYFAINTQEFFMLHYPSAKTCQGAKKLAEAAIKQSNLRLSTETQSFRN